MQNKKLFIILNKEVFKIGKQTFSVCESNESLGKGEIAKSVKAGCAQIFSLLPKVDFSEIDFENFGKIPVAIKRFRAKVDVEIAIKGHELLQNANLPTADFYFGDESQKVAIMPNENSKEKSVVSTTGESPIGEKLKNKITKIENFGQFLETTYAQILPTAENGPRIDEDTYFFYVENRVFKTGATTLDCKFIDTDKVKWDEIHFPKNVQNWLNVMQIFILKFVLKKTQKKYQLQLESFLKTKGYSILERKKSFLRKVCDFFGFKTGVDDPFEDF